MKKLILSTMILLSAYSAYAYEQARPSYQNGAYVAGSLGAGWADADWSGTSSVSASSSSATLLSINESWTPKGDEHSGGQFAGRAAFGYQFTYKFLYLAAEIGGDFSDKYEFESHDIHNFSVKGYTEVLYVEAETFDQVTLNGNEFTIDLRPGFLVMQNMLMYARMGLAFNELNIKSSGIWTADSPTLTTSPTPALLAAASASSKNSESVTGIRLGLGTEYLVTQNLGVSLDYVFTDYGTIGTASEGSGSGESGTGFMLTSGHIAGVDSPNVAVRNQTVMLGAMWHW